MASERDERLRRAERAVRQGQVETAIAEYGALVIEQPRDLSSANALGDLLVRAGRSPEALPLYLHVADSYLNQGFFSKAAGFYRKILKFTPEDEGVGLRLAEALAQQGLLVEAKVQVLAVAQARRARGDTAGADQLVLRVADLDPEDLGARAEAARLLARAPAGGEVDLTAALNALASPADAPPAAGGPPHLPDLPDTPQTLEDVFDRLREEASPRRGTEGRQQLALGRTYLAAGLVEAAMEAFRRAVLDPETRATAAVALAEAFEELEDRAGSLEWLERGADALESPDTERAEAMRRLAQALEADGEPDRALAVWLELVTLCPDDPQATDGVSRLSARRS